MTRFFVSGASRGIGAMFVEKCVIVLLRQQVPYVRRNLLTSHTILRRILEDPANTVAAAARNPDASPALQRLAKTSGDRLLLVKMDTTDGESIQVTVFSVEIGLL